MRSISLDFVFAIFLFSCKNSGNDKKADGVDSTQAADKAGPRTITDAIVELKTILESRNPQNIAALMDFPLADTVMNMYLDDSVFQKSYQAAGNKLTKALFLKYYDTISKFTYLDQVTEIFKLVPLDSLKYKNELTKEFRDKNDPCLRFYEIEIDQDNVRLSYGTNRNEEYKGKSPEQEETDLAGCEYQVYWIFRFDGNKLKLLHQGAAG
jgi:hypothetical protein